MPSGPFAHVCLLVRDLDQAIDQWTKILGVLDPDQLQEPAVRYDEFEAGGDQMRWATFVSGHGAEIQLMEPAPGTPLGARLDKRGEGVHHVCFTTGDLEGTMARLADEGIVDEEAETYGDPSMPWQEWGWIGPKAANGVLVEVAKPYKAVDRRWEPGPDPNAGQ